MNVVFRAPTTNARTHSHTRAVTCLSSLSAGTTALVGGEAAPSRLSHGRALPAKRAPPEVERLQQCEMVRRVCV